MTASARLHPGRALALGLRAWRRRFVVLHIIVVAYAIPIAFLVANERGPEAAMAVAGGAGLYTFSWIASGALLSTAGNIDLLSGLLAYLLQFLATGTLVRVAHKRIVGVAGESSVRAFVHMAFLAAVALIAFCVPSLLCAYALRSTHPFLQIAGFVVTIVLHGFLAATFWLSIPAIAIDEASLFGGLARGWGLARGSRFPIFCLIVLVLGLQWAVYALVGNFGRDATWLVLVFFLPPTLKAAVLAAAYRDTCLAKEGPRAHELDSVFG